MKKLIILALLGAVLPLASAQAETRNCAADPAETQDAAFHGGRHFSVQIEGDGPDVILIPGLASPREVWEATVTAQREHRWAIWPTGSPTFVSPDISLPNASRRCWRPAMCTSCR